jgi:hypothetical protein
VSRCDRALARSWLGDQLKALLLASIFCTVAVVAIYAVIRRARQTWWLCGAMVWKAENIDTPDIQAYDASHSAPAMPNQ